MAEERKDVADDVAQERADPPAPPQKSAAANPVDIRQAERDRAALLDLFEANF